MVNMMFVVVTYDITDDRRRRRVHKIMKNFGTRQQYSVFECDISQGELARMRLLLKAEIDPWEDSIRIYRMCGGCRVKVTVEGNGDIFEKPLVYVV